MARRSSKRPPKAIPFTITKSDTKRVNTKPRTGKEMALPEPTFTRGARQTARVDVGQRRGISPLSLQGHSMLRRSAAPSPLVPAQHRCSPCLAACPQRPHRPQAACMPTARSHALMLTAAQASGPPGSSGLPALTAMRSTSAQPPCLLILSDWAARHVRLGHPEITTR